MFPILSSRCIARVFSCLILFIAGCGGGSSFVPVSGTVTINGKPCPGLEVLFSPIGTPSNPAPGVFSKAITDADGRYELESRYGDRGAVAGEHQVFVKHADDASKQIGMLTDELETIDESAADAESRRTQIREKIKSLRTQLRQRSRIPSTEGLTIIVPPKGGSDINIELTSE